MSANLNSNFYILSFRRLKFYSETQCRNYINNQNFETHSLLAAATLSVKYPMTFFLNFINFIGRFQPLSFVCLDFYDIFELATLIFLQAN